MGCLEIVTDDLGTDDRGRVKTDVITLGCIMRSWRVSSLSLSLSSSLSSTLPPFSFFTIFLFLASYLSSSFPLSLFLLLFFFAYQLPFSLFPYRYSPFLPILLFPITNFFHLFSLLSSCRSFTLSLPQPFLFFHHPSISFITPFHHSVLLIYSTYCFSAFFFFFFPIHIENIN